MSLVSREINHMFINLNKLQGRDATTIFDRQENSYRFTVLYTFRDATTYLGKFMGKRKAVTVVCGWLPNFIDG